MTGETITCVKQVKKNGNSLSVHLTQELKLLGADYKDKIEITIRKI